ncbi:MAG: hypothetical protein IKE28_04345 [Solobacterium sp.]|nr:hypothetical protein [Solobacterium sp.]
MERIIKIIKRVLMVFAVCLCSGCGSCGDRNEVDSIKELSDNVNYIISGVTGTCFTREEMGRMLMIFDNIDERWSGYEVYDRSTKRDIAVPKLRLETPGEHEHDENTRYEITMLDKDQNGFCTGIKVSVMPEGACKVINTPKPSASTEPEEPDTEITDDRGDDTVVTTPQPKPESEYVWHRIKTEIVKHDNENGDVHKKVYTAEERTHSCIMSGTVEIPEHKTVVSSFTATCEEPPEYVLPGEDVIIHLSMTMDNSNDTYHYSAGAAMAFGYLYYGANYWQPAVKGGNASCQMDAIGDWGHPPVRVPEATALGTFPNSTSEGQQLIVTFTACGSETYWTYQLQKNS